MSFYCPHCNTENSAGYLWQGMILPCPACLRPIELAYRLGQTIPTHGYEITFRDFCRLVQEDSTAAQVHPLIAEMLDCTVDHYAGHPVLKQRGGVLIPLEVAHLLIQSDPIKQRRLYNRAMDLWR